jgi:hypothetical protein
MNRVAKKCMELKATCVFGTVSAKKQGVLNVMLKLGFNVVATFRGKYIENTDEYLICHENPASLLIK